MNEILFFSIFIIVILAILLLDLGVFSKNSHALSFREALYWTIVWVALSLTFYILIRFFGHYLHDLRDVDAIQQNIHKYGHQIDLQGLDFNEAIKRYNHNLSLEYLTGYIIEYSLSIDNIFVIIMIFLSFNLPVRLYFKVLFWGILGAVVFRFIFIFVASALIQQFEWILYVFGAFLLIIAVKMGWEFVSGRESQKVDTEHHPVVVFLSKIFSIRKKDESDRFWLREKGKLFITPLFIVLMVVEFSDVLFAVDSVPAVFSVTRDPYIVFFSNIFAILGLRSLFFLVSDMVNRFRFLKLGLAFLLGFVGLKMLIHLPLSTNEALLVIISILAFFILLSILFPKKSDTGKAGR
ncbi:MAG: TerC/Alx family metal homeostasis membrane protein [Bacteroidetes bacterium]|nr:TerC/Alx family metal homeostasis membrane protein [Bacteroidota bacterium]